MMSIKDPALCLTKIGNSIPKFLYLPLSILQFSFFFNLPSLISFFLTLKGLISDCSFLIVPS